MTFTESELYARLRARKEQDMSEKRYSVWSTANGATRRGPEWDTWEDAQEHFANVSQIFHHWRIWDHSTIPPTDVTDADPEAKNDWPWWQIQKWKDGSITVSKGDDFRGAYTHGPYATTAVQHPTRPTDAEAWQLLNDVLVKSGLEQLEAPEEPQWWAKWFGKYWHSADADGVVIRLNAVGDDEYVRLWATTADRDAKRDALLDAARKAGKPND